MTRPSNSLGFAVLAAVLLVTPAAQAKDWSVGGAWQTLDADPGVMAGSAAPPAEDGEDGTVLKSLAFAAPSDGGLTIGYSVPAFGSRDLESVPAVNLTDAFTPAPVTRTDSSDLSYSTSVFGGQVGIFGGVEDTRSAFALEPITSRTVGASVGYAGFYLQGAYEDSEADGLLDGRRAWQAGLGYGSDDFDVRVTYVQSAFLQGSPTELEGKQWMIGGLVQLTPSILLNANAFYIDREMIMPTVEPPGAGARVGVQLRF